MIDDTAMNRDDFIGKCRRFPPVLDQTWAAKFDDVGSEALQQCWEQPLNNGSGWCGEFKKKD